MLNVLLDSLSDWLNVNIFTKRHYIQVFFPMQTGTLIPYNFTSDYLFKLFYTEHPALTVKESVKEENG